MSEYKRLTIRNSDGSVSQPTNSTIEKVFNRLAELEDDLESGKIIRLPCKVGADVWGIIFQRDNFTDEPYRIVSRVAFKLSMLNDIGKTVFLTREEAEAKLKELEG